jgi:hypothetical protein
VVVILAVVLRQRSSQIRPVVPAVRSLARALAAEYSRNLGCSAILEQRDRRHRLLAGSVVGRRPEDETRKGSQSGSQSRPATQRHVGRRRARPASGFAERTATQVCVASEAKGSIAAVRFPFGHSRRCPVTRPPSRRWLRGFSVQVFGQKADTQG